jgi:putative molybdopterin biosynthesis protein
MAFSYLTNIPLEEARSKYLETLIENGMRPAAETVPVHEAHLRITAEPVYAHISAPHYHACAMDGIALSAELTFGASETTPVRLSPKDFQWVDTGDPLPENCDAVVMIEDVVKDDSVEENSDIILYSPSSPWEHVRQIGEDICAGEMIIPSYTEITPAAIGAMLAGGVLSVSVTKRPVVGIIPSGNEIVTPSENPEKGDIQEFNSAIFSAMLDEWGARAIIYPIVKDDLELITDALRTALSECDIVIINAGSSAGSQDYSASAIENIGQIVYHGIAIKPGKPAILGMKGRIPVMGVPGYPVSGIIVIEQLLKPIIARLKGSALAPPKVVKAKLSRQVMSTLKYHEFVRVHLGYVEQELIATNLNRGAGIVSSFMKADGILEIPQNVEGYQTGDIVDIRLLRRLSEIRKSLVITGSHDPLIDELFEFMRRENPDAYVASSHVGSMGGIMAVRNKAAHAAGVHLLDENTGEYNVSFIKKYFPQGGVVLVECVKRIQGIMVRNGNPKGIGSLSDMTKKGLKYVNRQKGSGTRILSDYLCGKGGIDTKSIYGYDHEEFTHTAVAALIDAGDADAGLGIYSAAQMYDLDFIPVCEESYDFLIAESEIGSEKISRMLDTLRSASFQMRLKEMGGYILENPGRIRI